MLAARGAYVIDADEVARSVLAPGSPGEQAVLERFGPSVKGADGRLDRQALARRVFSQPTERLALEAIAHPLIREQVEARLALLEAGPGLPPAPPAGAEGSAGGSWDEPSGAAGASSALAPAQKVRRSSPIVAVIEIPLLDRPRRHQYRLDVVVLVEAPADLALRRAIERGFSEEDARARLAAQPADEERRAAADRVLNNAGDLSQLEHSVGELWGWLAHKARELADQGREAP